VQGYNFTERARVVLAFAREESVRLRHEYVGTEHILLGLIREREGAATVVFRNLGIDPDEIARRVEEIVRPGRATTRIYDLPYTSRAKRVIEESMAEMRELKHSYVGTEHLLLGLLREEKGIAAQVLVDAGLTVAAVRAEALRLFATETPPLAPPPPRLGEGPLSLANRGAPSPERVELILHYRDGGRLQGSFGSAREAAAFLHRLDPLQRG